MDPSNLPLSTSGSKIVDKNGDMVRLACVNWYGAHMERYVVNGLDLVDINEIAQGIADKGFNCVRLVYSLEQYYSNPVVSSDALTANPSLIGQHSMNIFDATVVALTNAGVMVVLNNHISDAMWCCSNDDSNGLWHN
jgi:endoglucanase